ncbi:MAG: PfkB family carbohydrate kinase, partial [Acutalibacteraceae bacterium]
YTFFDNTEEMEKILSHFEKSNEKYDCIYTGYFGSHRQLEMVQNFISNHRESLVVVDPIMGDNGNLYAGFSEDYPEKIRSFIKYAHIITPNLTEAYLLTGKDYCDEPSKEEIDEILEALIKLGAKKIMLTGVKEGDKIGVITYDSENMRKSFYKKDRIYKMLHGTGDTHTSAFIGAYLCSGDFEKSVYIATEFVSMCIDSTISDTDAPWYGINFEDKIKDLISMVKK